MCGYGWKKRGNTVPRRCPRCNSILWNCTDLKTHVCKRCGHKWLGRTDDPLRCPNCRSKLWDADVETFICGSCGHKALYRVGRSAPATCPACGSGNWFVDPKSGQDAVTDSTRVAEQVERAFRAGGGIPAMVSILVSEGIDKVDAEVMSRYVSGESEISIARRMGLTFEEVRRLSEPIRRSGSSFN
ncbi:hypothetical protein TALC_01263 [Thermoplasmatales archaeon BRNA1]|nr:hypothetical protein TALC_01263 [Thermoplasmatales archaeon BRNA1]